MPAPTLQTYYTTAELCSLLRVSRTTVGEWRKRGILPPPVAISRKLLWAADAVDALLARRQEVASRGS